MIKTILGLGVMYVLAINGIEYAFGEHGYLGDVWANNFWLKIVLYTVVMAHLTITAMSLSFHRYHTHKGVIFNKALDTFMQLWLWLVTSMSKLDWVSVHLYHHVTSDTEKDPHSPVHKGFWHVFLQGAYDYTKAKADPEVVAIRNKIKRNKLEQFISENLLLGPTILTSINLVLFGPTVGTILSVINFSISPLFAVGGVNAVAHMWGYINHASGDNSRNIGFLFPLNFIICGELDHNNHHGHPRSCSFRHRWFEFDIGYFYIKLLSYVGLAKITNVYTPAKLKEELSRKMAQLMEKDFNFHKKAEELAQELNMSYQELKETMTKYVQGKKLMIEGKKVELSNEAKQLIAEMKAKIKLEMRTPFPA
jgi:stearoyl-CoA desaturase (delta-9 desaturase)